jgi:hypothetical protein
MERGRKMSEEKLYAVKNDEGKYWDFSDNDIFWSLVATRCPTTSARNLATYTANEHGGHVVTLVEESKKVVLPEKAAEWVDSVKSSGRDITDIFTEYLMPDEVSDWLFDDDDEAEHREERGLMLINAYLYGYTMEKKKYRVLLPESWCRSEDKQKYFLFDTHIGISWTEDRNDPKTMFTKEQLGTLGLDRAYFKKDEVTDDDE